MISSRASSDLSDPPSPAESEDLSAGLSSRPSADLTHADAEHLAPPPKRRRTGNSSHAVFERAPSSQPGDDAADEIEVSSDSEASAPPSPSHHTEWAMRDEAQTQCLWRDCDFGDGLNNDDLVQHVQATHCATGGPKKTKYVCEWGECQRKTSNHPSGYALKAHMRSHTKEKPYYCALPECDKAFTRSDALAKHMRTVHEPEPPRGQTAADATPSGRKGKQPKATNGAGPASKPAPKYAEPPSMGPAYDEDGNAVEPSPDADNISYIPAHHPITGAPGFMINYPGDIKFSSWESGIPADRLMRLLRRQLHWAELESKNLKTELAELEILRRDEWTLKELLLDGLLEAELARGRRKGLLRHLDPRVRRAMEQDVEPSRKLTWTGGEPAWRLQEDAEDGEEEAADEEEDDEEEEGEDDDDEDDEDEDDELAAAEDDLTMLDDDSPKKAARRGSDGQRTPSPPPTGRSGGFDGDADPYDNYLAGRMAEYEQRERLRSIQHTPQKTQGEQQAADEADAVGALVGMSGK